MSCRGAERSVTENPDHVPSEIVTPHLFEMILNHNGYHCHWSPHTKTVGVLIETIFENIPSVC
jgi:alpha-acetolactate decarboxylase